MESLETTKSPGTIGENQLHLINRLNKSQSPYLRQHINSPVAWQIWDEKALALAKKHNRLIFLNIGYASCHWCHVMERESFSVPTVALQLNEEFIPIKIDREERPDIDAIYMNYVQAIMGTAGHPLNVFITPDCEPLFGGTYWPGPNASLTATGSSDANMPFLSLLTKMATAWKSQEDKCRSDANEALKQLQKFAEEGMSGPVTQSGMIGEDSPLEIDLLEVAYRHFERLFDRNHGGFSSAPKFPIPGKLSFLLRLSQWPTPVKDIVGYKECAHAINMAHMTLLRMALGGIRDQIGYGFARASVLDDWSLPHFEKMLYDQAQLLSAYLDDFLVTRDPEMLAVVRNISEYLTDGRISAPDGGFFSSEDADSLSEPNSTEKSEGAFYVWTYKDVHKLVGQDIDIVALYYGISTDGNVPREMDPHDEFINQNVLKVASSPAILAQRFGRPVEQIQSILKSAREKMYSHRDISRIRPALDEKIVVSWNGLAIAALARTAAALKLDEPDVSKSCLTAATSAVAFIQRELFHEPSGTLYRVYSQGNRGATKGLCDDYAFLISGLIELYEATFQDSYLAFADTLQEIQLDRFRDGDGPNTGGSYTTPLPHPPDLLLRLKHGTDKEQPSCNDVSASNLFRLGSMLHDDSYIVAAKQTLLAFEPEIVEHPFLYTGLLGSVVMNHFGMQNVVLTGDEVEEDVLKKLRKDLTPNRTIVRIGGGEGGWLRERSETLKAMDTEKRIMQLCYGGICKEGGVELLG